MGAGSIPVTTAHPHDQGGAVRRRAFRAVALGLLTAWFALGGPPGGIGSPRAVQAGGGSGAGANADAPFGRSRPESATRRARDALRRACLAEAEGSDRSVDYYYEGVAFAYAAVESSAAESGAVSARGFDLYNQCVSGCLRAAGRFGRLDPRSRLLVETPAGTLEVPVVHRGFVWPADDFSRLINASPAPWNVSQRRAHQRCGLGAAEVVERPNLGRSPSDRYLFRRAYFPATAVLRPDLGPWLGRFDDGSARDVLELYDPIRTECAELAGRRFPLSADFDAPLAFAHEAERSRASIREGFRDPDAQLDRVGLVLLEPYQPGKVLLVFIHGLRDDPFHFTDMIGALRSRPGFADYYQIAAFRYPTGDTFLRSAAQLRRGLYDLVETFDPARTDPGLQNMVLAGFSMGGLLAKLQIASSGDGLWARASPRPLDALVTSKSSRALLRAMFYFKPVPTVRRVIYIATPHDGASIPTQILGRIYTRVLRPPSDTRALARQLKRDNPGAVLPFLWDMPSSLDLMSHERPFLQTLRRTAVNPAAIQHTIAGTAYLPDAVARGDGVMSLESAHVEEAASELHAAAVHTNICTNLDVVAEVERILQVHLDEMR